MRHRDTAVRVYDAPATARAPRPVRRAPALSWVLPTLLLGLALVYVVVGIYVQRFWP